jgi:hypothetical protein
MSDQTKKIVRNTINKATSDPSSIQLQSWNKHVGAQKNMEMGYCLLPIPQGSTYTTDASTIQAVPKGVSLAIYNPTTSAKSVRVSNNPAATLLAIGAVDNTTGEVGVVLPPNAYFNLATFDKGYVITSSGVYTYIIADDTIITDQAQVR